MPLFLLRLLLDWIGNRPTRCSLIPEKEAAVQLQTQVSQIAYPLVKHPTVFAAVQQLHFLVLSCNMWADSLFNPVMALVSWTGVWNNNKDQCRSFLINKDQFYSRLVHRNISTTDHQLSYEYKKTSRF